MNFLEMLEKHFRPANAVPLGFLFVGLIGMVDYLTGAEIGFSIFYVLPIVLVTWLSNRAFGLVISLVGGIVWLVADLASGHQYSSQIIPIWNTLIRLAFFVIITLILSALRNAIDRERELARIDNLTGAVNSRCFYEMMQLEVDRFQRYGHIFSLAYIDLDNFKTVNDRFGHPEGDRALRKVVKAIRTHLRKTDVVGRLGGDEFALLLPETDEGAARITLAKIQVELHREMQGDDWPITFSIGVLTYGSTKLAIDEVVKMADQLMYSVKREGKNSIKFETFTG